MPVDSTNSRIAVVGLGVRGALAEHHQRPFGAGEQLDGAVDGLGRRQLARRGVDEAAQRLRARLRVHDGAEHRGGDVEIHTAGAPGDRGAQRAGDAPADVLHAAHPVGGLAERLRGGELVHLLVVALLEVDQVPLAGAGDLDHGEAVGGGVRQGDQTVEEARRGHGQADAGLLA